MDIVKLGIQVDSRKVRSATKDLDRLGRKGRDSEKSIASLGRAFRLLGGAFAIGAIVNATRKQEQAVAQLEAGLASTGNVVGKSIEELVKKAEELQKVTTFGDEELIGAQSQLLTFTGIVGEEFDKTIELAADLSARMGTDLKSSIVQLGKALNDPIANLSALSRSGIQFNETQKETIKDLVASNRLMDAQKVILDELETQFGGSARAARDTFGGAIEGLGNAFGDLMEADGDGLVDAKDAIENMTKLLQDPATVEGINRVVTGFINLGSALIGVIAEAPAFLDFLRKSAEAKIFGPEVTGDIVIVDDALRNAKDALIALEAIDLSNLDGLGKRSITEEIEKKKEEIDRLQKAYDRLSATPPPKLVPTTDTSTGSTGPTTPAAPTGPSDAFAKLEADLNRQIALYGETGEAARLRYSIENDQIKGLLPGEGELLIALAEQKDALDANKAAAEEYADTQERLAASQAAYRAEIDALVVSSLPAAEQELRSIREDMLMLNLALEEFPGKADQINDAIARLSQREQDLINSTKGVGDEVSVFAEQAARNIQDSLGNAINDLINGTEDWERTFIKSLLNIISQAAAADLAASLGLPGAGAGGNLGGLASAVGSILSFDGGGSTGSGPRIGGIDGKGGFPAVLHPNETVVDHTRGQSSQQQQVNVNAVTVLDANSIAGVLSSPELGSTFINQARINRSEFRAALGINT